jgi:hypothetical protein
MNGPYGPGGSTADRLTAALHARTSTLGEDTLTTRAPGYPSSGYVQREPLLPRWGWVVAALAVIASVVAGALLGLRADSKDTPVTLPPARTQTVDGDVTGQAKITLLAVRGQTLRLELDLKNLAPAGSTDSWSIGSKLGDGDYDLSGVTLTIDGLTVRPRKDGNDCDCTGQTTSISPQGTLSVFAVYTAPKTLPKTADVYVPGFGSWLDVPVSK